MAISVEQLRDSMHQKVDQLRAKVEEANASITQADLQRQADIDAKVAAAQARVQEKQEESAQARNRLERDFRAKRTEWRGKVEGWKAARNREMLDARAEDAESYATMAIGVAFSAVDEADLAILEAIQARQDANAAAAGMAA